jgi:tetratricopeptide (TPR) repeat protein
MRDRDWVQAERRLRKAMELAGPNDYDANFLYALFLMNVGRPGAAIPYEERAMRAEPLLMRPVAFLAALHEMRGDVDAAESLLLATADAHGQEPLHKQGVVIVHLARHDVAGLRRATGDPWAWFDDPQRGLEELRGAYDEATSTGAHARLFPVAIFASYLGDQELALDALRALGPTQNLHALWSPTVREVRALPGFEDLVTELGLVDYWRASAEWGEFCSEIGSGGVMCR